MTTETRKEDFDVLTNQHRIVVTIKEQSLFSPTPEVEGWECRWVNRNAKTGVAKYVFYRNEEN